MTEDKDTLIRQQHDFIQMALMPRIATQQHTLRDQFAMAALAAICAKEVIRSKEKWYAELAYEVADAMMEARK